MGRGRDTHRLIIDGKIIKKLVASCDNREAMVEIFRLVWELAFKRITVAQFDAACQLMPCILWKPDDPTERHMVIRCVDEQEPVLVSIARIVWRATHVCSEQGPDLRGHEEVLHSCGNNGINHTGYGACMNPAHLWRGDADSRVHLKQTRELMRRAGQRQVAAP